jgi:putative Ca2+/H+ antiporter (TMEM165/GDT1 family)
MLALQGAQSLGPRRARAGETFISVVSADVAGTEGALSPRRRAGDEPQRSFQVFPVIFLGELPDKTMFASLVLSTKGRLASVWLAAAFAVHVAIAVRVGVALFTILPHRAVDALVAAATSRRR